MENLKPKYTVQKSQAFKNLEALNNGQVFIPKWVVVCGSIVMTGLVAVFATSIALSVDKKPNGLYNEDCSGRSCEKYLGLKCINKVCLCPEDKFYLDSCRDFSTFNEPCRQKNHCKEEENLTCGLTSKCECSSGNFWNSERKRCVTRKTYYEVCDGNDCKEDLDLICNSGLCSCKNNSMPHINSHGSHNRYILRFQKLVLLFYGCDVRVMFNFNY
ncbi:hypothetical protein BpHYR1_010100 [Brachionus plicatilis]|uniref:Prion-like-(Q N-rich) domain-bearing 25 n=1 Tax=Brachionus plicatilis TaxID=10195 RepID=A0A3M7S6X7_BRAPC|nr:hypothetical protein BpHYR1_010100 [Brachionus plicatilis]